MVEEEVKGDELPEASYDSAAAPAGQASRLLLLGAEDGQDGLVKHRLQALLSQRRALQVTLGSDLKVKQRNFKHKLQQPHIYIFLTKTHISFHSSQKQLS